MDSEYDEIPEVLKPVFEASQRFVAEREINDQKRAAFDAAWKEKAISIEAADQFLDAHGKSGMFLVYWEQDATSDVGLQSLTCGKTKADQVMANMLRRILAAQVGGI